MITNVKVYVGRMGCKKCGGSMKEVASNFTYPPRQQFKCLKCGHEMAYECSPYRQNFTASLIIAPYLS